MQKLSTLILILMLGIISTALAQEAKQPDDREQAELDNTDKTDRTNGDKDRSPDARMLRFPDVSEDNIVFVYAGDLWIVPKQGGTARKLSSPRGRELLPKFSPDGRRVAFSGNYDGNTDIYIMPTEGGEPARLTYHPEQEAVVGWYPDGKHLLLRSGMLSPTHRTKRLFKLSVDGGVPEVLPLPYAEVGSLSPDGKKLAFQYILRQFRTWKRYKGGMASNLWLYDFENDKAEKITEYEGTDSLPMWHGDTIYFLSDRGDKSKLNIWAYELGDKKIRQVTRFTDYDVRWPSLGPSDIVFENGGKLYLLGLSDEQITEVNIDVPSDLPHLRARLKDVSKQIENFAISPTGKRALVEARGEIFSVPRHHGSIRNLSSSSGSAERFPVWSPDGKYIAYLSDKTGEYEIYLKPSDGRGEEIQLTNDGSTFRYQLVWSPDSKKLAWSDNTGSLYYIDDKKRTPELVDKDERDEIHAYSWSPKSRWIAYTKQMSNGRKSVFVYDTKSGDKKRLTSNYYNDNSPEFDPDGKYIYFFSDRKFTPVYSDMQATWIYPNSTEIYALPLRKDLKSPLALKDDIEEISPKPQHNTDNKDKKDERIDFDDIAERAVKLPPSAGNFGGLTAVSGKVVYLRLPPAGVNNHDHPGGKLMFYDLNSGREGQIIGGVNAYKISADGKKILYKARDKYGIVDFGEGKNAGDGKIAVGKLKAKIDPREEWSQIFTESWRILRDYFYDPNMHGVDWNAVRERYEALLPHVVDREDLNYVIGEMLGELNSSHTYVGGGDMEVGETVETGLLGADIGFDADVGAYRIDKIYSGGELNGVSKSPLDEAGMGVREGEYILTVDGRGVDVSRDFWASFEGLVGEVTTLGVSRSGKENDIRNVLVKPIKNAEDQKLRYLDWVEQNRKRVHDATEGRVGYVYVPDTGRFGQSEFVRQFIPQHNMDALIIDERFNGGGQVPDRFIELLNRPTLNYWARRGFDDLETPSPAHTGPKVMIINGWSGSGGDALPYYFRKSGLGPLVGTRTLGGLIGVSGNPLLIDGGFVTAPSYAFWNSSGKWEIEGYGVEPDYEVDDIHERPGEGVDPQLEKSIEVAVELLGKQESKKPNRPEYPDRAGKGQ